MSRSAALRRNGVHTGVAMRDETLMGRQYESGQAAASQGEPAATLEAARAIGRTVRRFRHSRGWSLQELAERSALCYQFVSEVETGKRNFSIGTLAKLCEALGVQVVTIIMAAYDVSPIREVAPSV